MQFIVPVRGTVEKCGICGFNTAIARRYYRRAFRKLRPAPQTGALRNKYARSIPGAAVRAGLPLRPNPFDETARNSIYENFLTVDPRGVRTDSCTACIKPVLKGNCAHNLKLMLLYQECCLSQMLKNLTAIPLIARPGLNTSIPLTAAYVDVSSPSER